ncbi:MAG: cell envelope integrity protein CreD [Acidobacteria bacterium]|nr:MAG: cell envelope integrity protein CreD [Acidobacteriota bacterium]
MPPDLQGGKTMFAIESERRRLRDSTGFKMMAIGGLVILLLIPLGMVGSLIGEREHRQSAAADEVAATWGKGQLLSGPVLTVPYRQHGKNEKGDETVWTSYARFLPATLAVDGRVLPERRHRGIFETVVYRADLHWAGSFARPGFEGWSIAPEDILWKEAYLSEFQPGGAEENLWNSGLRVPLPDLAAGKKEDAYAFDFDLGINGSQDLKVVPMGQQTTVALRSPWPSPSFSGAFLPESSKVTPQGFQARWNVSGFARSYPQQWRHEEAEKMAVKPALEASAFGVDLFLPVDAYQKTERSVKYGVLFLILTFLTFFLYEVFSGVPLHPMQYFLVGSALCVFYLLLLSISEHAPFGLAYLVAAAATVLLIGGYSAAVLHGRLRALLMAVVLGVLYGYLYVLLQLEDYALLLGSIGLFLILALVMFLTRRIDWGSPRRKIPEEVVTPG